MSNTPFVKYRQNKQTNTYSKINSILNTDYVTGILCTLFYIKLIMNTSLLSTQDEVCGICLLTETNKHVYSSSWE